MSKPIKKYRFINLIAFPTVLAAVAIPLSLVSSNSNNAKPEINKTTKNSATLNDQTSTGIFNVKDGVLYGFKEGTTKQDLLDNMKDNTLVLPECKTIADGAFRDTILNDAPFGTTITIPSTTTSIGNFAFYGNSATSVTWSGTPTCSTIGKAAFGRCKSITSFTLPASITAIGADAFMGSSSLATIECKMSSCPTLGNKSVFRGTKASGSLTYLTDSNAESIWMNFVDSGLNSSWTQKNSSGTVISKPKTIPTDYLTYNTVNDNEGNATLTITGVNTAVCDITKFNKLVIPAAINGVNVTQIGGSAFQNKTSLTTIDLSSASNLTTINASTFQGCTAVTSVSISTAVTTIGNQAFYDCNNLTTFTVPSGSNLATIGEGAFNNSSEANTKLNTFAFENTKLTTIGKQAFRYTALTSVTMPSTLKALGVAALARCASLTTINMGSVSLTDTVSPEYWFSYDTALTSVTLPTNITTISKYAFSDCTALASITIPSSVETIVSSAFSGCTALTDVTFANASNAFTVKNGSTTVNSKYFPSGAKLNADHLRSKYSFAINPVTFKYTYLNVDNAYASTFSIPFSSTSSSITWTSSNTSIATVSNGKVTVKKGVTGDATITATITGTTKSSTCKITAITSNSGLVFAASSTSGEATVGKNSSSLPTGTVTIPAVWNSRFVTETVSYGFNACEGVTTFNVPGTIKKLGEYSFHDCTACTAINFQEPCNFTLGGNHMFGSSKKITSITLPEGLTSFTGGNNVFRHCAGLTTITMPSTVETIAGHWFSGYYWGSSGNLVLDMSRLNHVPTLTYTYAFGKRDEAGYENETIKIKVKSSMLEAFKNAAIWKTLPVSEWLT